jgi:hypothetical protein
MIRQHHTLARRIEKNEGKEKKAYWSSIVASLHTHVEPSGKERRRVSSVTM